VKKAPTTKHSASDAVDLYLKTLRHPRIDVLRALRRVILKADKSIGEEIKWNAPAFFYTGEMAHSDPKQYARYLVVSNLFKKDCIRLVFWHGDRANDASGFLEGTYADGRRLASFSNAHEVAAKARTLRGVLKKQLEYLRSK
jgi:hypothetical protein